MNNSINPLLPSQPSLLPENQPPLQIAELSPELSAAIKAGTYARLEMLSVRGDAAEALLHVGGESFKIVLQPVVLSAFLQDVSDFPVRIGSGGQLFPLKHDPAAAGNKVIAEESAFSGAEMSPLKLDGFIERTLQEFGVPQNLRQQAARIAQPLKTSLAAVGSGADDQAVLQPLKGILREIASAPENFAELKHRLAEIVEGLSGRQISGTTSGRINEMTRVNTPLGETFLISKMKFPPAEKLLLNINGTMPPLEREARFLDSLLKLLLPGKETAVKPESVVSWPQLRNLAVVNEADAGIFAAAVSRLPFHPGSLFENMYNFYQAAVHKDINRWLGADMAKIDAADAAVRGRIEENLKDFVASALKETPSWRIVEMPLFDGTQFKPLKIALKKDRNSERQHRGKNQNGTRFIVETEFSKLGRFQFDGFSSRIKRSLDLVIRTSEVVNDDFCANIINLFKKSLYNLDYTGSVKINRQETFIGFNEENTITGGIYV